jgi:hypothetical protein
MWHVCGKTERNTEFWCGILREGSYLENLGVEVNTQLDLKGNRMEGRGLDCSHLGHGQVAGSCDHGNEPSGSIKCGVFLDYLLRRTHFHGGSRVIKRQYHSRIRQTHSSQLTYAHCPQLSSSTPS